MSDMKKCTAWPKAEKRGNPPDLKIKNDSPLYKKGLSVRHDTGNKVHPKNMELHRYPASLRQLRLCPCSQFVQVVGPRLHHVAALRQVFGMVAGGPHGVLFTVGKLALYPVPIESLFIEQGGAHCA